MMECAIRLLDTRDSLDDQIIVGEGTSLVETANIDFAGEWNSEGLRTKHTCQPR